LARALEAFSAALSTGGGGGGELGGGATISIEGTVAAGAEDVEDGSDPAEDESDNEPVEELAEPESGERVGEADDDVDEDADDVELSSDDDEAETARQREGEGGLNQWLEAWGELRVGRTLAAEATEGHVEGRCAWQRRCDGAMAAA